MTINIDYESEEKLGIQYKVLSNMVVSEALKHEGCTYDTEVSILITDDEVIKELNTEYRDIKKTTDVLSFPAIDFASPADFKCIKGQSEYFNPETGELILGDIALSVQKIKAQADQYGHSVRREFAFLITHSILHLLGYDHINDEERLEMEKRQEEILSSLGINR